MQLNIISTTPYSPNNQAVLQVVQIVDIVKYQPFKFEFFSEKGLTVEEMIFSLTGFEDGENIDQLFGCDYMTSLCSKDNTDSIVNELISQFSDPDYVDPQVIRVTIPVGEKELYIITASDLDCCGLDDHLSIFDNVNCFGANGMDDVSLLAVVFVDPSDYIDVESEEDYFGNEEFEDHLEWVKSYRKECSFLDEIDEFAVQYAISFGTEPVINFI